MFVFSIFYFLIPSSHSVNPIQPQDLLLDYIHNKLATPIPPKLINTAINIFTPLLSNQSLPLSTRRLSCSSSCALPADSPTDDCVARLPLSVAVLARVSVWRRRRFSDEPCRPEDASLVPPGREEEGWMRTYTVLLALPNRDNEDRKRYLPPTSPLNDLARPLIYNTRLQ